MRTPVAPKKRISSINKTDKNIYSLNELQEEKTFDAFLLLPFFEAQPVKNKKKKVHLIVKSI